MTKGIIVAFMIAGTFLTMAENAMAKWVVIAHGRVGDENVNSNNSIVLNPGSTPDGIGEKTDDWGQSWAANQILIGSNARGEDNGREAIAIGNLAHALADQSVVVGAQSWAGSQSVAVGANVYAMDSSSIAIGSDDNPAYRQWITKDDYDHYFNSIYGRIDPDGMHYGFIESNNNDQSKAGQRIYSPTVSNGKGAIALGSRSVAFKDGATSMGTLAFALGKGSTSVGTLSRAEGDGSIALGNQTKIFASNSVGTGNEVQVLKTGGMGYGYKAYSGGEGAIAIGRNVFANTLMIGRDTTEAEGIKLETLHNTDGMPKDIKTPTDEENERITQKNDERKETFEKTKTNAGEAEQYITKNILVSAIAAQENKSLKTVALELKNNGKLSDLEYNSIISQPEPELESKPESQPKKDKSYIEILELYLDKGLGAQLGELNGVYDVIKSNKKKNAIVIGTSSVGLGNNSIALGKGAFSLADNSFAIGSYSYADKENAIALGLSSKSLSKNAMAFGVGAAVGETSEKSISIGSASVIQGSNSAIFGTNSYVQGNNSIVIGTQTNLYGNSNLSFGNKVDIQQSENNLILGNETKIAGGVKSSVVLGNNAKIGDKNLQKDTNILNATAIGFGASVVEGAGEKETGINAMALGKGAEATLENSVALGVDSKTDYSFEKLQRKPWASRGAISIPTSGNTGVISIGSRGKERRLVNLASGSFDTDAVNVAQLKTIEERFDNQIQGMNEGGGIQYLSVEKSNIKGDAGKARAIIDKVTNYNKYVKLQRELLYIQAREELAGEKFNQETVTELQDKVNSILAGDSEIPQGKNSPFKDIFGAINKAKNETGEAKSEAFTKIMNDIGNIADKLEKDGYPDKHLAAEIKNAKENNYLNQGAEGIDSIAFGYGAATSGSNDGEAAKHAIAIGFKSEANSESSIVLGDGTNIGSNSANSIAIGKEAKVIDNMADSIAIGARAKATEKNSIALGKDAETSSISKVLSAEVGGITYGNFSGDPTTNGESRVLSIGKNGEERTITNVAAGRVTANSTDAINGSQLYATNNVLSNVATTSKNVLGNSFELNTKTGELTASNIGGTGKNTVSEAIASLGDKTVTLSDGSSRITKVLKNNPEFILRGNSDINVVVDSEIKLTLNKGAVVAADERVVSGDAVSKAIAAAKPIITGKDEIDVDPSTQNGADKFTISLNKEKLITKLGDTYITKNDYTIGNGIDSKKWKEKLGVSDLGLHYKASEELSDKTTTLAKGLAFSGDENIKISTEDNGIVKYVLKSDLSGINSIGGNSKKISFETDGININEGKLTNLGSGNIGVDSTDGVNGKDVFEYTKGMAKKTEVLAGEKANITFNGDNGGYKLDLLSDNRNFNIVTKTNVEPKVPIAKSNIQTQIDGNVLTITHSVTPTFDEIHIGGPGEVSITKNIPQGETSSDGNGASIPGMIYAAGYKIANIAPGEVKEGSKAAINGDQLWRVDQKVLRVDNIANSAQKQAESNKISIRENKKEILAQGKRITGNEEKIEQNKNAIESNKTNIASNISKIETNIGNIEKNTKLIDKGWTLKVTDSTSTKDGVIHLGRILEVEGEKNIVTALDSSASGNKLHIAMIDTPQFGNVKINDNGKITGVKGGENNGEVITYEQLKPTLDALNLNITGGTVESPNGKYLGKNSIADALSTLKSKSENPITFRDGNIANDTPVKLGEDITFKGNNNILINLDKNTRTYTIKVSDTPQFGNVKINDNGKITGVQEGKANGEVITFEQYKELQKEIKNLSGTTNSAVIALSTNSPMAYTITDGGDEKLVIKTEDGFKSLDSDGKPTISVDSTKLNTLKISALNKDGDVTTPAIKLSNIGKGNIESSSTEAINGSQLKPVIDALGMKVDNGVPKEPIYNLGNGEKAYTSVAEVFEKGAKGEYGTTAYVTENGDLVVYAKNKDNDDYGFYKVSEVDKNLVAISEANKVDSSIVKVRLQKPNAPGRSDVVLTNIAAGIADNDAVNVGQLKNLGFDVGGNKPVVKYDDVNKTIITLEGGTTTGTKITNLADGTDVKDAVNFGQLDKVKTEITNKITTSETTINEIKDNTWKLAVNNESATPVKQGKSVTFTSDDNLEIGKDGVDDFKVNLKLKNKIKIGDITVDGSASGKYITGLTNKDWNENPESGRAATEDQLGIVESKVNTKITEIDQKIDKNKGELDYAVKYSKNADSTINKNLVELGGTATKITNLADGNIAENSRDAVNGSQLFDVHKALMGNVGVSNPLHFSVELNDNNNFKPITVTEVRKALEILKGGWRVSGGDVHVSLDEHNKPQLHLDAISGATNIVQGQTLVLAGDGKNLTTHSGSRTVTEVDYRDPKTGENIKFTGKIGMLQIKMSDTPTFEDVIIKKSGETQGDSVVVKKDLVALDNKSVKYDDPNNKTVITLNPKGSSTTIKNLNAGSEEKDAVNVKQASQLIGNNLKYDSVHSKWVKDDGNNITFEVPNGETPATNILDAINLNTKILNKGIIFAGDIGRDTQQLGSTLSITTGQVETDFLGKNLKTEYKKSGNDGTITVGLSANPEFSSLVLTKDLSNKVILTSNSNELTLQGNTPNDKVTLNGLKAGETPDSAVTKAEFNALEDRIGSLDGSVGEQVQELQDGMTGAMVYTNRDGDRLVKVSNNYYKKSDVDTQTKDLIEIKSKYYAADAIENGHIKEGHEADGKTLNELMAQINSESDIIVSGVKPQSTGDTTNPIGVGNIASGLGLTNNYSIANANEIKNTEVKDLLSKTEDKDLNRVSTLRDLQAIAKAGLNFKGNDSKTIERPLGSLLSIEGRKGVEYIANGPTANNITYSDTNIITHSDNDILRIEMLKSPKFEGIVVNNGKDGANGKNSIITVDKDGNLIVKNGVSGHDGQAGADGLSGKDGKDGQKIATVTDVDELSKKLGLNGKDGLTGATGSTGPAGKDGLDGQSILEKVQGLRDGLSGTMVYTDKDGNRLVKIGNEYYKQDEIKGYTKAKDGHYYTKVDKDGNFEPDATKLDIDALTKIQKGSIRISAVDPEKGDTKDNRMVLNNIKSAMNLSHDARAISDSDATTAVSTLLKETTDLDKAATGRDLQAVAQAGIKFKGNDTDKISHISLSGTYNIKGSDIEYSANINGNSNAHLYSSENLITHTDGSDTLRIEMLKSPKFESLQLVDGGKKVTLTLNNKGLTLSNPDNPGDSKVVLSGLKAGTDIDSAVTKGQLDDLKKDIGLVSSGTSGKDGAAGKDGLDGKTISEKLQGLREGLAGTVVYTDNDGNRLVRDIDNNFYKYEDVNALDENGKQKYKKANDGKYYTAASVNEDGSLKGSPVLASNVLSSVKSVKLSAVDKNGETTTPITLGNIQSGLELKEPVSSENALKEIKGLQTKSGSILNNAATILDLQTLAKAGMVFKGNEGTASGIHKGLGEILDIKGKPSEPYDSKNFSGGNIVTRETHEGSIMIEMLKSPSFRDIVINGKDGKDGKSAIITVDKDGNLVVKNGVNGRDGLNGLAGENGRDGLTKIVTEKDMNSGTSGTMVYTDENGNRLIEIDGKYYPKEKVENKVKDLVKVDGQYYAKNSIDSDTGKVKVGEKPVDLTNGLLGVEKSDVVISTVDTDGSTTTPIVVGNVKGILDSKIMDNITNDDIRGKEQILSTEKLAQEAAQRAYDEAGNNASEEIKQNLEKANNKVDTAEKELKNAKKSIYNDLSTNPDGIKAVQTEVTQLTNTEKNLDKVATVGDLRVLAISGLDFIGNDEDIIHRNLGTKLNIEGKVGIKYSNSNKGDYSSENLITHNDNGTLRIQMLKKPKFEGLVMSNGKDGSDGKTAVIGIDGSGNLIVKNGINGTNGLDGKDGFSKVVTEKDLKKEISNLQGSDGTTGSIIYTDNQGNPVVKGSDGYFYTKDENGKPTGSPIENGNISISAVNGDGLTEVPISLRNAKSTIRDSMKTFGDTSTDIQQAENAVADAKNALKMAKDDLKKANKEFVADPSDANRKIYFDAMDTVSNKTKELQQREETLSLARAHNEPEAILNAKNAVNSAKQKLGITENSLKDAKAALKAAQEAFDTDYTNVENKNILANAIKEVSAKEADRQKALAELKDAQIALNNAEESAINSDSSAKVMLAQNAVKDKLLSAEGKELNTVATVGDLQTVAVAGVEFAGNSGNLIHKNLGEQLNIEGKKNAVYDKNSYSSDNLATYNDEGTLRVAMLKNPKLDTLTLGDGTNSVTLGVDGKDGIGIKGKDGKIEKFVTENKLDDKLQGKGFKVKVTDGDGNSQDLDVKLGDTIELKNTDKNIVLKGTSKPSISGGITTDGTSVRGNNIGGSSGTSGTSEHSVDINLAKNLKVDNIKVNNKIEAKEIETDNVKVNKKLESENVIVNNEFKVGKVTIDKDGNITGVKTAELDETGHIVTEDEDKLVNGGTLNKTIENLRAENAQFREGVQGAIQQNSQRISKLETKVNKGLANAAAMAGINFMEIGVNQATVGAAVGGYEGTQAVAVGVQAAPTQDLRINAKVSLTPGAHSSSMYSVGASWRFDIR